MSRYLIAAALPYANGRLHIGHVAGAYLPADIYVRFLRLNRHDVIFVCGTDEHGTPISIKAESEGKTPQQIVDYYHHSITTSFDALHIEFDNFSGTARAEHHKLSQQFFLALYQAGKINVHETQQTYCQHDQRFLPDRYVEGECPHCHATGARGDQCDACGKLIDALQLINPKCMLCGHPIIVKDTVHWFLDLPSFADELKNWIESKVNWKDNVAKFMLAWIEEGLKERPITRDLDWGVPVPLPNVENKVLYVWFDAPIGYISSTIEYFRDKNQPDKWKEYWLNPDTKLVHFIGKDNIPFHAIIWPAILMGQHAGYVLPYDIPANEYLTLEGEKISTSRDYAIWVEDFVKEFDGELLRFTLAVNAPESRDADFSWADFQSQVNNTLANVLGNLANRTFTFANKYFQGKLNISDTDFIKNLYPICEEVHTAYTEYKVRKAVKTILDLARDGNKYFDEQKPWVTIKTVEGDGTSLLVPANQTIFNCLELLRIISILLMPVMPHSMLRLLQMLGISSTPCWEDIYHTPDSFHLSEISILFHKIPDEQIERQKQKLATVK